MKLLVISALSLGLLLTSACSTTANFVTPPDTKLTVYERPVNSGLVKTSPFFWTSTTGIPYKLEDQNGKIVRQGMVKSKFRVASIFWPPFAIIYWPMGFAIPQYDLTKEDDGYYVKDTVKYNSAPATSKKK